MIRRRALIALFAAGLLLPSVAAAQQPVANRRIGVHWNSTTPRLTFSARDLVNADVRRKLQSGLPQTIAMRIYSYTGRGGRPVAIAPRSCRITYDLWEEVYRVQIQDENDDRSVTARTIDDVVERCLVARNVPVGSARDYRSGGSVYFAVMVEFNPMSPDTVQRIRRWLARPGGRVEDNATFGSFVSLFVNRQIGDAERVVRFRSQPVEVP